MVKDITKLDLKDKKILYELEKNARQSNQVLGRKIGVNPDLVRYRINSLVHKGVIKEFLTFVNFSKLGLTDYGVFISTRNLSSKDEKDLISYLKEHTSVTYLAKTGGRYDFIMGVLAKNTLHFHEILSGIIDKWGDFFSNRDIAIRMTLFHFPKNYLSEKKESGGELPKFGGVVKEEEIDELDEKILKFIATNARANVLDISEKLDEPPSTISLRIKKMKEKKIIEGFFTLVDSTTYGFSNYDLTISFSKLGKETEDKFYNFCRKNPYISWMIKTVGKWDYEVGIEVPDQEKFQEILRDIRENFSEDINNIEFVTIFDTIKYNLYP